MGIDRFVRWHKNSTIPSLEDLKVVLEDYLGEAAKSVEYDKEGGRFYAILVGKPRFPFRRIKDFENWAPASEQRDDRFFEVYVDSKYIDIITRQTDEFTNVVAQGFADLAARFWKGKKDS